MLVRVLLRLRVCVRLHTVAASRLNFILRVLVRVLMWVLLVLLLMVVVLEV